MRNSIFSNQLLEINIRANLTDVPKKHVLQKSHYPSLG